MFNRDITSENARRLEPFLLNQIRDWDPGTKGGNVLNKIIVYHADGSEAEFFDPTDAGMQLALAAVTGNDDIQCPPIEAGVITTAITVLAGVGIFSLGNNTIISAPITFAAGGYLRGLIPQYSVSSVSAIAGVTGSSSGTIYLVECHILTTNSGAGDAYGVQGGDGNIVLWNSWIDGEASGGGDGYGIATGAGEVYMEGGWLYGSTAPVLNASTSLISTAGEGKVYNAGVGGVPPVGWAASDYDDSGWDASVEETGGTIGDPVDSSDWITHTDGDRPDYEIWAYRNSFTLGAPGSDGTLDIWADNEIQGVWLNGVLVWAGEDFGDEIPADPAVQVSIDQSYFVAGTNVLAIQVANGYSDDHAHPTSLSFSLAVDNSILTNAVRMDPPTGEPTWGDKSAWNVDTYADRHAKDINDGAPIYHNPIGADAGEVPIWDGSKWVPGNPNSVGTRWEPLANGNPASPALVFDAEGDVIMTEVTI